MYLDHIFDLDLLSLPLSRKFG